MIDPQDKADIKKINALFRGLVPDSQRSPAVMAVIGHAKELMLATYQSLRSANQGSRNYSDLLNRIIDLRDKTIRLSYDTKLLVPVESYGKDLYHWTRLQAR